MSDSRQRWGSKAGFLISAIGSAIGLGNIWRYPYVLYKYGGGAFLIPYFVAAASVAIPLLVLEYTLGSKYRGTSPLAWARVRRNCEWIGWLPGFCAIFITFYYTVILAWAMVYIKYAATLAWGQDTNTFFFGTFLKLSDSPMQPGGINTSILIPLVILWGSAFLIMRTKVNRGLEWANKIMMPLAIVIIAIIIVRGIMLPGAVDGLNTLFTPRFEALYDPEVWLAAFGHVFFSCSIAMGVMITYSSYLPKKSEITNSASVAALSNFACEIACAIGIFAILGYMAGAVGKPVTEVVSSGIGLAFIAFPSCINTMGDAGVFFGIAFFLCLFVTGYTSFLSLLEAFAAPLSEKFGIARKKIMGIVCAIGLCASSIFATGAGLYILDIVDHFINNWGLVSVGIAQAFVVGWILKTSYIHQQAIQDSYFKRFFFGKFWIFCMKSIPFLMAWSLIQSTYTIITDGYEGYPTIALLLYGVLVIAVCAAFAFNMQGRKWTITVESPSIPRVPGRKE